MPNLSILDIAKLNATDEALADMIEESLALSPELADGEAKTISGVRYTQLVRTSLPSVGFRQINAGVATTKGDYENRITQCYLCDASSEADSQAAQVADDSIEDVLALEMQAKIEAYTRGLSSQFYYGQSNTVGAASTLANPSQGFNGLVDLYDSTNMAINRGGSSGAYTSVWLVRWGGPRGLRWVVGNDGMFSVGDTQEVRLTDASSNPYDGLRKSCTFWVGLQVSNPRNVAVRIRLIDAGTSPTAGLDDSYIARAITLFPAGLMPDVIYMTRNTNYQLQNSRTATSTTGAPAPFPMESMGVPIKITGGISETETS